jgi:polysaccharide biosynthesis/export protein
MLRSRYLLCVVVLLFVAFGVQHSVSSAAAAGAQTPTLQPKPEGNPIYVIQPYDVLEISEWKEQKISRNNVLVRPDGRISIPLAQDVIAAGLNPTQLKEKLERLLKDSEKLVDPYITVIVATIHPYIVYVTGQVPKNGPIVSPTPLSVIQAISAAGGFTQFAKKKEIVIIRGSDEDTKKYSFNHDEVVTGNNFAQNFPLKSGDVIYVP